LAGPEEVPKALRRTFDKLASGGEEVLFFVPALLERYCSQQTLAMARLGNAVPHSASHLVITDKNLHFIRTGIVWDRVQTIPLEKITGLEYVDEFHTNTIKLLVGELSERIVFLDDLDGIRFYKRLKQNETAIDIGIKPQ